MKLPWSKKSSEPTNEQLDKWAKGITNNQEITKDKLDEVRPLALQVFKLERKIDSLNKTLDAINPGGYSNVSERTKKKNGTCQLKKIFGFIRERCVVGRN